MSEFRKNAGRNRCSVEGCDRPFRCSGYCGMHYARFQKQGTPDDAPVKIEPKYRCVDCSVPVHRVATRCHPCNGAHQRRVAQSTRRITDAGYVTLGSHHDHPNAQSRGHIFEHTLVMSEMLGRALLPGENVHHKNGVRHDNRPENLELWVVSQPAGQRAEDLVEWAHEILRRYA